MKKFLNTAVLAVFLGALSTTSSIAQEMKKLGSVETQELIKSYWKMKILNKDLKKEEESIKKENEAKVEEVKALNEEILKLQEQLKDPNLPRAKREELQEDGKVKFNRLNSADRTRRDYIQGKIKALNTHRGNKQAEMVKDIKTVIAKYAAENGYDAVVESQSFLFLKKEYDVTAEIKALLNAGHEDKAEDAAAE